MKVHESDIGAVTSPSAEVPPTPNSDAECQRSGARDEWVCAVAVSGTQRYVGAHAACLSCYIAQGMWGAPVWCAHNSVLETWRAGRKVFIDVDSRERATAELRSLHERA